MGKIFFGRVRIFFLFLIIMNLSCGDIATWIHKECTTAAPYQFHLPVMYSPNKYVFNVGDTIKVSFDFSDEIKDQTDKKTYKLVDYKQFFPAMRLIRMEGTKSNPFFFEFADTCAVNVKKIYILHDKTYSDDAGLIYDFNYNDEIYTASISFVLKEKGIYYFQQTSGAEPLFPGSFEGQCKTRKVEIIMSHNYDTNFDLVKWLLYPNAVPRLLEHNNAEGQFRNIGGYAFEVK